MDVLVLGLMTGISLGFVLFLLATGLSIVLGLMGIINVAHGALFMVGLYVGITVAEETGNFLFGLLAGAVAAGMAGLAVEWGLLRHLYKQVLGQILITFGLVYIIENIIIWIWGSWPKAPFVPLLLSGYIPIGEWQFPIYRLGVIIIGAAICSGLWWLQDRTKIGAIVRAGMDDAEMVSGLGINLRPITVGAFGLGTFMAGLAAIIGVPLFGAVLVSANLNIFFMALAVCIIGGLGSVQGALIGALLIGIVDTFTTMYFGELAMFSMYLVMILILLFRPRGLLGRKV